MQLMFKILPDDGDLSPSLNEAKHPQTLHRRNLLNMQAVCKGMDHCSNYLSMRIDLQRLRLLYTTHTHIHPLE